ncbi:flagellar protein FlaG [Maricaulis sp.]|uniref:flagellar protein FlaG n=1 Tax=Maricaulis sp. TaxID=1486257 RepID=UPI0025BA62ED|nr:flagellar protein FlaG [Maricaulis sp.]
MAETGFNPRSVPVAPISENRDTSSDRPRETAARVEPVEKADKPATDTPQQREQRAEDIERLAREALKNSRLKILQDENSGDYIYLMVDQDTGEQIRRWPPEKHGDLMEYLRTKTAGLLDAKA